MPGIHIELGYYPYSCNERIQNMSLEDLPELQDRIAAVNGSNTIDKDWLYAPAQQQKDFTTGQISTLPYNARVFGLPKTHMLTHDVADSVEHLEFLVWCLGFFVGMRLTTTEAGFLDATPLKRHKLTDFILLNNTLGDAMTLSESFWQQHGRDERKIKRLIGIIHMLFLAQYPRYLEFEEFTYLYTALDACFALTKSLVDDKPPQRHTERIDWMCRHYEMSSPSWAVPSEINKTEVSVVRNDTFHEALFFEQPLGFTIYGGDNPSSQHANVLLEMRALVCRLLVALLGKSNCDYVKSRVNTRQIYGLNLA